MYKCIHKIIAVSLVSIVLSLFCAAQVYAAQVDINSADAATIAQGINGIGPSKAQAIVEYRDANGPFASLDDLVQVQGIGTKTLDRIREFVILTPASVASPASESPAVSLDSKQPSLQAN